MSVAILLVEDDALMRSTLTAALQGHGLRVTAVGSAREALAVDEYTEVALLDLDLGPGPTGVDLAVALRERSPDIGLVLLTTYDDPRLIAADLPALPRGTRYLRKRDVEDVTEIVRVLGSAASAPHAFTHPAGLPLTPIQIDVLRGVAEGLSTAEIARRRGVSDKAVENTITRLCEHFGLERDAEHNQRVRLAAEYYSLTGQVP